MPARRREHFIPLTLLLSGAVLAAACATRYQNVGLTGGYSETQLAEEVFRVSFAGNGFTSMERAVDFALLRSAELALAHGFSYFIIVAENTVIDESTFTTPTQSTTTGSVSESGNFSSTTTTVGGQSYRVMKPSATNTIVLLREKRVGEDAGFVYEAEFVAGSIRNKYGIR